MREARGRNPLASFRLGRTGGRGRRLTSGFGACYQPAAPRLSSGPAAMTRPFDALLSVVVPCFNEQEVIRETHRRLTAALRGLGADYEILYVDDGSRDETPAILREIQAGDG